MSSQFIMISDENISIYEDMYPNWQRENVTTSWKE